MGTISQKLTYLNDTKGLLKEAINDVGGELDEHNTFRSYVDALKSAYDNFPKVTPPASNELYFKALNGKMEKSYYGDTYQENGATPETPKQIYVVKGKQVVKFEGKNLLNYNIKYAKGTSTTIAGVTVTYNTDGSITLNVEMTENNIELTGGYDELHINVDNAKTYYSLVKVVSGSFTKSGTVNTVLAYDCIYYTGTTPNAYYRNYSLPTSTASTQLDVTGTAFLTRYRIWQDSSLGHTTFNNFRVQFAIYEADNTTEWESYQAPGSYPMNLRGKNLFDKNNANIVNGWLDVPTRMGLSTPANDRILYIPCKPNTTYTVSRNVITSSFRVTAYDYEPFPTSISTYKEYVVETVTKNNSATSITYTTGANAKYLAVHYGHAVVDAETIQESLNSIQIEERFYSYFIRAILRLRTMQNRHSRRLY
jgi:hypothetical protein